MVKVTEVTRRLVGGISTGKPRSLFSRALGSSTLLPKFAAGKKGVCDNIQHLARGPDGFSAQPTL